jgi:hypothetical protein
MFQIDRELVKVRSVTNVPEFKGEKREHGCSVKFELQTDNTILDVLEPGLRRAFYEKDNGKATTNNEGQDELPLPRQDLDLTKRKFPFVHMPLKIDKEFAGYKLVYHCGATETSEIKLGDVALSDFSVDLQKGGTVLVVFGTYSKPGADVQGRIDHMAQTQIEISLIPPEEKQQELAPADKKGSRKKTAAEKAGGSDDPFAGSDLAQDDTRIEGEQNALNDGAWPFPKPGDVHGSGEAPPNEEDDGGGNPDGDPIDEEQEEA